MGPTCARRRCAAGDSHADSGPTTPDYRCATMGVLSANLFNLLLEIIHVRS
jgi:hypothetical protein